MSVTSAAAMQRYGAHAALAAASVLVYMLLVESGTSKACTLAVHVVLQLGCGAVLLSPAHQAAAVLIRRAAAEAAAWELFDAHPREAYAGRVLRWAGFACILFYGSYAASAVAAEPAAATDMPVGLIHAFLLFLIFLAGVWMVSLSMLRSRAPPAAMEQELDDGEAGALEA